MKSNITIIFIILLLLSISLVFYNCETIIGSPCEEVAEGSEYYFWAVNLNVGLINNDTYCQIGTKAPIEGEHANVYMQTQYYDASIAQDVATAFDNMYSKETDVFGYPVLTDNNIADGSATPKVTILLLNVLDGFDAVFNPSYVAGFFYSVDYLTQESLNAAGYTSDKSNEQALLYIDISPQDPTTDDVYSTVAHEFQHMINFSENILDGSGSATIDEITGDGVPTWIDEGFAMAAEHIWATETMGYEDAEDWPVYDRITYFNNSSYFVEGNPLIKWVYDESGYDVLSNYSTSFLFFQYLRAHAGTTDIFTTMMNDTDNDINQIDGILADLDTTATNFEELLEDWIIANKVMDDTTGVDYGYNDDTGFTSSDILAWSGSDSVSWDFYPGSFMYRKNAGTITSGQFPSGITYFKIDSSGTIGDCSTSGCDVLTDEYLVLYNADTDPDGSAITVTVPSGTSDEMAGAVFKSLSETGPQRMDFIINKPFSEYFNNSQGKPPLRLPEFDNNNDK